MSKFVIISDSSCGLDASWREKYGVDYLPNRVFMGETEKIADIDWQSLDAKEFFDYMREGNRITTSQILATECREKFENYMKEGYDVLAICCAEALSAGVNVCRRMGEELMQKYPERKVIAVNSTRCSGALSILCIRASELRAEGKSIEETAQWVEEHKKFTHQLGTVEKLTYLKRAGRVSASSAFFGGLLNIKPILISDVHGNNAAVEKVKGRAASLSRIVERAVENYTGEECADVFIRHADDEDEAMTVKMMLLEKLGLKEEQIHVAAMNPVMSAATGPGTLGVYFYGKEVTHDAKKGE